MAGKIFAGERVRQLRQQRGMALSALSQASNLSMSYLSQIENNQRPLSAPALAAISAVFGVEQHHFADDRDLRLGSELREVLGDPLFADDGSGLSAITDAVRAAPAIAGQFIKLYRAYQHVMEEGARHRLDQDVEAGGTAPFPYDDVRDFVQSKRNHFPALDVAAESLFEGQGFASTRLLEDLIDYLRDRFGVVCTVSPGLGGEGVLWRYDPALRQLHLSESAPRESRIFFLAQQIGRLQFAPLIEEEVRRAPLGSAEARALAYTGLANYFAGALILPYGRFLAQARAVRHDIERLQHHFGTSFEQVCHRLSTMQRPGNAGIPFYFLKVDRAGNIFKRSSATRFQFARFGGACPLWNVHEAFAQPGRILVQVARTPDGITYLCIARTVTMTGGGHLSRPREAALGLGCEIGHAGDLVYAAGLDLQNQETAVPIGSSCKVCDRDDCRHRAFPSIGRGLAIAGHERHVVPFSMMPAGRTV
ncbi:MAG: short-chain fatty acyl-CoA regulator family protein [Azospirillaceae bacterium]|nr:short-chain fatty acyl-CoA regulator family protein [Azospirillaceae bacterium]